VTGTAQSVTIANASQAQSLAEKDELIRQLRQQLRETNERDALVAKDAEIARLAEAIAAPLRDTLLLDVRLRDRSTDIPMRDATDDSDDERVPRSGSFKRPAKIAPPDKFKGKSHTEATKFIEKWQDLFDYDPRGYPTEYHKVIAAAHQLEGEPDQRWSSVERKKFRNNSTYTFEDFETFVHGCVSNPLNRGFITGAAYEKATQKQNQTVSEFAIELATMEEQCGRAIRTHRVHSTCSGSSAPRYARTLCSVAALTRPGTSS
jgi:hypothetical protein